VFVRCVNANTRQRRESARTTARAIPKFDENTVTSLRLGFPGENV